MRRILPLLLVVLMGPATALGGEWSHWRGPLEIGVAPDKNLPTSFNPRTKENVIWSAPVGGRSTPLVFGKRVFYINKTGEGLHEQEQVVCLDADTGKVLWQHKFNVFLTDIVSVRLGWTQLAGDPETGNVYAHGTQGLLFCFDKDGKILWQRSLTEEYGRVSGYGGRVTSPIVDGDLLIIGMLNASWGEAATGRNRFVAFDKKTGAIVWWASTGIQPKDTYYSTPVVGVIGGQRLLVSGGGDGGVHAFKVRTGEKVWSYIFGTAAINCSPVIDGDLIYIGQGEENDNNSQGRVICVNGAKVKDGKPEVVWQIDGIKAKFASPLLVEGRLYICDEVGQLYCLDAKTGKQLWDIQYGKNTKGSPVYADGKIYISEVNSKFHILQPKADGCDVLHSQLFRKKAGGTDIEINGSPAVAYNRVYFMTSDEMYCIGLADAKGDGNLPKVAAESPADPNAKPAHLQIFPAEVVLHPGESAEFKARAYDDKGRFLKEVSVAWELTGMLPPEGLPPPPPNAPKPPVLQGELSAKEGITTKLTLNKMPPVQFGRVIAKLGDLSGYARVRVAPVLPYTMNLVPVPADMRRSPAGWVNTQGKFEVVTQNTTKLLKKRADVASPLVARAYGYIGLPTMKDYTVEADVMGTKVRQDMPDMGVLNCRYSLVLDGNKQTLRLLSWDALPRVDKTIAYAWKPGVWYRLRLTVKVEKGEGIIRGKVWPRDEAEPKDWSIEFIDPSPNSEGAPGIYGYATGILDTQPPQPGAEVYYDNVKVRPN